MLSRRGFLTRMVATGMAGSLRFSGSSITPVRFVVPKRACDCHVHVFDPGRFPFAASRTYTPESATAAQLLATHRALHISRVVIVQPSVYGTDNSCLLDAMKQYGSEARGIAVLPIEISSATLDNMERAGIRGVRINLGTAANTNLDDARRRLKSAIEQIQGRKWCVQIYAALPVIRGLSDLILASPVPVVLDHFGGAKAALGLQQPGFDKLLDSSEVRRATSRFREHIALQTSRPIIPIWCRWRGRSSKPTLTGFCGVRTGRIPTPALAASRAIFLHCFALTTLIS